MSLMSCSVSSLASTSEELSVGESRNEEDGVFPTVNQRLGYLRPSKELLEYYRQKISEYDGEYDKLIQKLDKYKCAYEQLHKNQWEIRQREDEIAELQKALSDMQVFLFQEREHVLRLYAENDRLKIRELEDRKRMQYLLTLTQPVNSETTYFLKDPPAKVIVHQHKKCKSGSTELEGRGPGGHKPASTLKGGTQTDKPARQSDEENVLGQDDKETLLLTVEALKAQLEEQTRLCKEQVDALLEDRRVRMEEAHALTERDTEKIKGLTEQLHTTQGMLYDSTKDYLDLKYQFQAREREWMADKDQLLRQLDHYREQLDISEGVDPVLGTHVDDSTPRRRGVAGVASVKQLQLQLQQSQQLADNYREQCISMEEELCQLKEEVGASKDLFRQRTEKMTKRLGLMNSRYEALEKRRAMEIEGYKNDIKLLRQRLKEVEKQLYKLTMTLNGGDQDMEILTHVKRTATRSKKLVGDLQNLKAKIYSLEKDVHHQHDH